jgi:hypothetical protein
MAYVKGVLAGAAAIFFVPLMSGFCYLIRTQEKATGWAVIRGGLIAETLSPLFWIEASCVFGLFFLASRLGSKALRVFLFWIPAIAITSLGCAVIGVMTFVVLHFGR